MSLTNNIELSQIHKEPQSHTVIYAKGSESNSQSPTNLPPDVTGAPASATKDQIFWGRVQFLTLCWTLFLAGWNDGSTGPLLPRIQTVYNVNFTIVSLIFVFACVGFFSAAVLNALYSDRFGFGKMIVFGSMLQTVAYVIQTTAPPFPAFVLAFVINGLGLSIQDAQANGFVVSLKRRPETKMGMLHAAYGVGAFCAPLVATQFSQMNRWSFHYLVSLCMSLLNTVLLIVVFRFQKQDDCLAQIGQEAGEQDTTEHSQIKQILTLRAVHYLAFFLLFYVGVEVTIGGWIVTYAIEVRGGGPDSGYISAGFFGGLTLGRVLLLWVNEKIGERRVVYIYGVLAIGLELVVWLVPSLIGGAVAVSFVGLLLGPFYPIAMNHAGRVLPKWILTGAIGWMAGFGQAGSAALPFITGVIANKHGIQSLQPFLVAMMSAMLGLWALTGLRVSHRHAD